MRRKVLVGIPEPKPDRLGKFRVPDFRRLPRWLRRRNPSKRARWKLLNGSARRLRRVFEERDRDANR